MTHATTAARVAAMERYHMAWNVLLAAYADLVEATVDPALKARHTAILDSFVAFREAQADYYTWMGLMLMEMHATMNETHRLVKAYHTTNGNADA